MGETVKPKRCAIYTRKSTDEGLDKEFSSLDAQRELGENKVKSQMHDGWEAIPDRYDDGGISGGTMEREGLQKLLEDIEAGKVDIVIVYKIDRLSRSMLDFLGMMKFFDEHNVSFVSVTQDLNTDTAMGRLVLNVLQSFAQFEREIASERIKDKITLSKEKGLWMGGAIPIGYDTNDGKLKINKSEAEIVRFIFSEFIRTASTTQVVKSLKERGYKTKGRTSRRGNVTPPRGFTKQSLYKIMNNKVYIGKIEHKKIEKTFEGQHKPIIDMKTWNQVQAILAGNKMQKINFSEGERPYLLKGLLQAPNGRAMTPSTSRRKKMRYRYYVNTQASKTCYADCTVKTVSAPLIEEIVLYQAKRMLTSTEWINRMMRQSTAPESSVTETEVKAALNHFDILWDELYPAEQARIIQLIVSGVVVHPHKLIINLYPAGMASVLREMLPDLTFDPENKPDMDEPLTMEIPIDFRKGRNRTLITAPDGTDLTQSALPKYDNAIVKAVVRAHQWEEMIENGQAASMTHIANKEGLDRGYVASVMRLTALAPDITAAILNGRQPQILQLTSVIRNEIPYDWNEQRRMLGFNIAEQSAA